MSVENLKSLVSDKLIKSTVRIKNDYNSLMEFEKLLKTPNLTTMQLNNIEESLNNIETHLRNFSYKSLSKSNRDIFLTDLKEQFYEYINQRNTLQSKLLSIQNKVDTRILIHKRRGKEKNKVLSERLTEIQNKLKLILQDINDFDLNASFSQSLEHFKLINRNLNKILADLENDNFNLFKESTEYISTIESLSNVKEEFLKLKNSIVNLNVPISDLVRLIESLKLTYIDKIPLYEIYESFNPVKRGEIDIKINEAITNPSFFPNMNMSLDTLTNSLILKPKELENDVSTDLTSKKEEMTSERRYEIFKRVLKKFESIKISLLANLLGMKNETEVLEYILEIPDEFGFKIQEDMLVIEQHEVLEHIDMLVSMFESGVGKESKI